MKHSIKDILTRAKARIEHIEHWCQGDLATDNLNREVEPWSPRAYCFCADGAIQAEIGESHMERLRDYGGVSALEPYGQARDLMDAATRALFPETGGGAFRYQYVAINDGEHDVGYEGAHVDILAVFDEAIARASAAPK